MTKLDRINKILGVARKAIDDYERKALKGEATYEDRIQCADFIEARLEDARHEAAHVEGQAGEVVEVRR